MAGRTARSSKAREQDGERVEVRVIHPASMQAAPPAMMPTTAPEVPRALVRELGIVASDGQSGRQTDLRIAKRELPPDVAEPAQDSKGIASPPDGDDMLEDPELDEAVDQIVAREGDELLAVDDARHRDLAETSTTFGGSSSALSGLWHNRILRALLAFGVLAAIASVAIIPMARYTALNAFGVRVAASLTITDLATQQPLAGVPVQLGGATSRTGADGVVRFEHLRLGAQTLRLDQPGFAIINQPVTLGWGENPLGGFTLTPTGTQYTLRVQDYFSGKAIAAATAAVNGSTAQADKHGIIVMSLPPGANNGSSVTIAASGYRSQTLTLGQNAPTKVSLVPTGKDVFFAKSDGTYNVYDCDLDGQNQTLLLAGTGSETAATNAVATSPANTEAAVVSLRGAKHDTLGAALYSLTLINLGDGTPTTIDTAEQIRLTDWQDTTLIYELTSPSDPSSNAARSRIISFNYATNVRMQLAAAGQFSVAMSAQGTIYYADSPSDPNAQPGLFAVNPDGSDRQTITTSQVLGAQRADYNTLDVQTGSSNWQTYPLGSTDGLGDPVNPGAAADRLYATSPDGQQAAWIGGAAGSQPGLFSYNAGAGKDIALQTTPGAIYPLYWVNDKVLVYRVGGSQPADYAMSMAGGTPRRITAVAPSVGFSLGT